MKILFLNHNVAWRGGFFRAYHWGRHLVRRGHSVTIVTISENRRFRSEQIERDGVLIIKSPDLLSGRLRSGWDPWDTVWRINDLRNKDFDVVHSVDSRPVAILPGLFAKNFGRATLVLDWGDWWGRGGTTFERPGSFADTLFAPVETFFEERFRQFADGTVALSSALVERARALGVPASKIVQIPHGADVESIVPRDCSAARQALGLNTDIKLVGYVGVMFKRDALLLIDSFREMRRQNRDLRLALIGNSNIVVPSDLLSDGGVFVTGGLTYELLQTWIAACDLMLLPMIDSVANRGRWPSKLNDYLSAGRPVVCSKVGDVAPLVQEGACGILPDSFTPESFAEATLRLLASPEQLAEMGRHARATAESKLDWRLLTGRLEQFYSALRSRKQ